MQKRMEEEEGKPTPRCCRKAKGWTAGLSHVHTDPEVGGATDQVRNQRGMRSAPKSERDKDGMGEGGSGEAEDGLSIAKAIKSVIY